MKVYGANIRCAICDAHPFPDNPATTRETFDLQRLGLNGLPAESPAPGEWRCEAHPIANQDLPVRRAPRRAPTAALTDFENLIASEAGLLEEAAADEDAVPGALITFREEVARGLASLRKAVAA